jgi:hypothetical protein
MHQQTLLIEPFPSQLTPSLLLLLRQLLNGGDWTDGDDSVGVPNSIRIVIRLYRIISHHLGLGSSKTSLDMVKVCRLSEGGDKVVQSPEPGMDIGIAGSDRPDVTLEQTTEVATINSLSNMRSGTLTSKRHRTERSSCKAGCPVRLVLRPIRTGRRSL